MLFQWHPNTAWNPERSEYWDNQELIAKVREFAASHIASRRKGTVAAKTLNQAVGHLFEQKNIRDAHIFAWMVVLHMHEELEDAGEWSLPTLYEDEKLNSIFSFIFHLSNDLGSVTVMKALSQRGHSPRLYECEEGTSHYPKQTSTMWADVGNAMYGYVAKHLELTRCSESW